VDIADLAWPLAIVVAIAAIVGGVVAIVASLSQAWVRFRELQSAEVMQAVDEANTPFWDFASQLASSSVSALVA